MKDIRSFYEKLLSQNILWYFGVSPLCSFLVAAQLVIMDRERGREASTWISFIFLQFTFSSNYLLSNIFSLGFGGVWRPNYVFIHPDVSFKLQKIIAKKITVLVLFWIYVCNRNPILWAVCPNLPQKCRSAITEPKSWILHSCCSSSFGLLMSGEFAFGGWSRALLVNVYRIPFLQNCILNQYRGDCKDGVWGHEYAWHHLSVGF